jgi:Icc protein
VGLGSAIRLAQLSDTHIVGEPGGLSFGQDSAASLAAVVDSFPARPDVAVITGDLAEDGSIEAYRKTSALTSALAGEMHVVDGNHDDRAHMREVFGAADDVRVVPLTPRWTMVLVSSQWPSHDIGRIGPETLDSLDDALARTRQHTVVCMHHPPASTCDNPYCGIVNAAETMRVLQRHRHVRAVLSGHLHRAFDHVHDGIRFLGAPSTCVQLMHGGSPHFRPTSAPPAARLLELHADGAIKYETVSARYADSAR